MTKKICIKCNINKDINNFHRDNSRKDGHRDYCKDCNHRLYYIHHAKIKIICSVCKKEFIRVVGNQKYCSKKCYKEQHKKYLKLNIEKIQKSKHKWYLKNRTKEINRVTKYRQIHKEEIRKSSSNYEKNRKKIDVNYRIRCYLASRIWKVLKGIDKSKSTIKLLGCSIEELKNHLASKFTKGMSWDNYGKWHIDHIKPCASFDLNKESEQRKCFHYTNLQPLWAEDNLSKGAKYD
jgi:ribosomal protein S27E